MGLPVTFMTLDPAHFHAALVHKEMHPDFSPRVHVYAPLGPDLMAHLERMASFNNRANNPTHWQLEVHTGPDFLERMLKERPGNVVMLSGRNRQKIDYMLACVEAGLHVLADKPWIIRHEDFPKLERLIELLFKKGSKCIVYDMMTERLEITNMLQRDLIREPDIFGEIRTDQAEPAVEMKSIHALKKNVAGQPLRRPVWFFDLREQGEGLADVGTHLVDLVNWMLFPEQSIDYAREVEFHVAERFATLLSRDDFRAVTGEDEFPPTFHEEVKNDNLEYYCNNQLRYSVRDVLVRLDVIWNLEASSAGGDVHNTAIHGTRSSIRVRQTERTGGRPELYVIPDPSHLAEVRISLSRWIERSSTFYPGLRFTEIASEFQVEIPDSLRIGHEAHFAQVIEQFLRCLRISRYLSPWEMPNLLTKYYITTKGVALARTRASGEHAAQAIEK